MSTVSKENDRTFEVVGRLKNQFSGQQLVRQGQRTNLGPQNDDRRCRGRYIYMSLPNS
jgi:hypothetical protein